MKIFDDGKPWEFAHLPHVLQQLMPLHPRGAMWREIFGDAKPQYRVVTSRGPKNCIRRGILEILKNRACTNMEINAELEVKASLITSNTHRLKKQGLLKMAGKESLLSRGGCKLIYTITRRGKTWLKTEAT
jgi:predicted transcriptional regulator